VIGVGETNPSTNQGKSMTYQVRIPVHQVIYGAVYPTVEADSVEEAMALVKKNGWEHYVNLNEQLEVMSDSCGRIQIDEDDLTSFNDPDEYEEI
jgi:hypothetical protein